MAIGSTSFRFRLIMILWFMREEEEGDREEGRGKRRLFTLLFNKKCVS